MATVSFDYSKTISGVTIERYCGSASFVDVPYSIAGKNVNKIGNGAFAGCTNLKEIRWDRTLIKLGGDSVKRCGNDEIQVPKFFAVREAVKEIAPPVASKLLKTPTDDFVYSRVSSGIAIEFYRGSAEVVVVPSKIDGVPVVSIGFDAFGGRLNLKELRLPDGLRSINWRALDGCSNLQAVYMPRNLLAEDETKKLIAALPEDCKVYHT